MPTIPTRINQATTTTPSSASAAGSAVTGTGGATTTTTDAPPAQVPPPVPSAAGDGKAVPVVLNGFGGKPLPSAIITLTPQPGQAGFGELRADVEEGGWVKRGFIDVRYQPAVGGVDIEVESHHVRPSDAANYTGDELVLTLQARVRDGGAERIVTLAVMFDGVMNPDKTSTATRRFHLDYQDINQWLKARNPNLELVPGDPLAVYALWKTIGHQWGGFCREGSFDTPAPLGRTNAVAVRTGAIGTAPTTVSVHDVTKPIDITLKLPDDLVKQYPLVLDDGAKYVSRREHETKFCPKTLDELKAVTRQLLDVSLGSAKDLEARMLDIFGADPALSKLRGQPVSGWKIHTTDRYYAKDDAGNILKNADGLPIVVPMFDVYQDRPKQDANGNESFPFARHNMAVRFRDGEIKAGASSGTMGKLNMKTPRVTDPFNAIQTGLELSLDTRPGISKSDAAMSQLAQYLDSVGAPYNPMREQKKVAYDLHGDDVLHSAVNNLANRYKFTLEHENGMELEVSLDFVHAGFMFESKVVEATKAMSEAEKFDHYAKRLAQPDSSVLCVSGPLKGKAGELNTVVLGTPGANGQLELTMATFWTDAQGAKHATEHPAVRFPQVEIEMDHVQARSTGPVQAAYSNPNETKNLENDTDQDAFLKSVSANVSMGGPPTTHLWEDLKDIKLYQDPNYQQLSGAVTSFRQALFPGGVSAARQKAAQALEVGGYVPTQAPTFMATLPSTEGRNILVTSDYQNRNRIEVKTFAPYQEGPPVALPAGGTAAKPGNVSLDWDGFPIKIPLTGSESTKQVAELIQQRLDQALFFKAELSENNGVFSIDVKPR